MASFLIGNILLVLLNVPLIDILVKLLRISYQYVYFSSMFFVYIGVYSISNYIFLVAENLVIDVLDYLLLLFGFYPTPVLLGFVLGPRLEENFRRAMQISRGNLGVFVERPISAVFIAICAGLIVMQVFLWF